MVIVRTIRISGFRGILAPLEIDFVQGGTPQSLILYGANGTGKSSITDAWEWLSTGRIQHLAREGAEEGAYPHMAAKPGTTLVEVDFSDAAIGTVGLAFDPDRKTIPTARGNVAAVRKLITHQCHIRYGDLTRFVLLRKTDRYEALASLMGFVPQMEYQKALRRVQVQFETDVRRLHEVHEDTEKRLIQHFSLPKPTEESALRSIAHVGGKNGFQTDPTIESVHILNQQLAQAVAIDPKAKKLVDLQILETAIKACAVSPKIGTQIGELRNVVGLLKAEQKENLGTQLLIPLFQAAVNLLSKVPPTGNCPLCGKGFDGDLREHVKGELARMRHLDELLSNLKTTRETLSRTLAFQKPLVQTFDATIESAKPDISENSLGHFRGSMQGVDETLSQLGSLLTFDSTAITDQIIDGLKQGRDSLAAFCVAFEDAKSALIREISERKATLDKDPIRSSLVADAQFVAIGLTIIAELKAKNEELRKGRAVLNQLAALIDNYVSACLADVEKRFNEVSEKVKVFFGILERNTVGLGAPKLRLLTDQDRSVVLEVLFHGTSIQPAYKYLSESQLSSFGLAVFLASAIHFNKECRFLILDDVVNSFDAYKRPQLVELIKDHLKEHQVLLLTHDRFWRESLHRSLPTWKRLNFTSYNFGIGPTISPALDALERVNAALSRDEADEAGQIFARYLEDVMQELGEAFEIEVKFNRRNEYTLDTLLDRFRVRVQEKLRTSHPLTQAVTRMFQNNAYRNWSVHCKNPESPIQSSEVRNLMADWVMIQEMVTCKACFEVARFDGKNAFLCRCGQTRLAKVD